MLLILAADLSYFPQVPISIIVRAPPSKPILSIEMLFNISLKEGGYGGSFQKFGCLLGCSCEGHVVIQHLQD
jgi:hypothetical protein